MISKAFNYFYIYEGVLVLYREQGIATKLIESCVSNSDDKQEVFLHVQTDNNVAIRFYEKIGFSVAESVDKYFKRSACTSAFKMELYRKT